MRRLLLALAAALALVAPAAADAAVITYATPGGSMVGGQPVSASVTFTTSNGGVTVVLTNSIADPVSVIQNISGVQFTIAGSTLGAMTSSSGKPRTIAANGTFSDGPVGPTDWLFSFGGGTFTLNGLGSSGPDQTIVGAPNGSNVYASANGSIAGNGPHNPFLPQQATFLLSGAGITQQSLVSGVILYFGTAPTAFEPVCREGCGPPPPTTAPEPTSMVLLGTGLIGVATRLRRKRA